MASRLRSTWLVLGCLAILPGPGARAAPSEEKTPSTQAATEDSLRRCGYRPGDGVQVLGKPVVGPTGGELAFFEQHAARYELVVCMHGAAPARWLISDRLARLKIFWVGRTEIIL